MHTYIHTYMHAGMHTYIAYTYVPHACTCMYDMHTHKHTQVHNMHIHTNIHTHVESVSTPNALLSPGCRGLAPEVLCLQEDRLFCGTRGLRAVWLSASCGLSRPYIVSRTIVEPKIRSYWCSNRQPYKLQRHMARVVKPWLATLLEKRNVLPSRFFPASIVSQLRAQVPLKTHTLDHPRPPKPQLTKHK